MKRLLLTLILCVTPVLAFAQDRIIFNRPDGGVSVVVPAPEFMAHFSTPAKGLAAVRAESIPSDATDVQTIDVSNLPARTFRNAWRQSGGVVSVDMPAARDLHAGRIASAHAAEIARLKIKERKERLKGKTTQANAHAATVIALEALNLNTLATQIGNAPNPTALSAIWPANVPR